MFSKIHKDILQRQIQECSGDNLFVLAQRFYESCNQSQQKKLLICLKETLTNTLNASNNKQICSMYFNINSITDIFPFAVNQHIISFLNIALPETTSIAKTSKIFYQIYANLSKQNYLITQPIAITLHNDRTQVTFHRKHKNMDYPTFKRSLQYVRSINMDETSLLGSEKWNLPNLVFCDQFLKECKELLSQIRNLFCRSCAVFANLSGI